MLELILFPAAQLLEYNFRQKLQVEDAKECEAVFQLYSSLSVIQLLRPVNTDSAWVICKVPIDFRETFLFLGQSS